MNDKAKIEFSSDEIARVDKIKSHYPEVQSALMPVLWLAQKKWGWLSTEVIDYVSRLLGLPYSEVFGVATFYTMFFKKEMGKYHIQVCTNVSCMLGEGEEIYNHLTRKLGISHNEKTGNGLFSLEEVECMGACGGSPMIAINEDYYENVDINKVDELIRSLEIKN